MTGVRASAQAHHAEAECEEKLHRQSHQHGIRVAVCGHMSTGVSSLCLIGQEIHDQHGDIIHTAVVEREVNELLGGVP